MSAAAMGGWGRWVVSALGATGLVGLFLFLVRLPAPPAVVTTSGSLVRPTMRIEPPDTPDVLLQQAAELRDLRPMFLPTDRNATLPEPKLEPGRTYLDSERVGPANEEVDLRIGNDLPKVATLNGVPFEQAAPRDVFAGGEAGQALAGFGRSALKITPLPPRGGFVEVIALQTGKRVLAEPVGAEAAPSTGKSWSPLEMMAVVEAAGLAFPLVVTEGSRVDEVDLHFKNYLAQSYRIGDRLPPGFYRIVVSP